MNIFKKYKNYKKKNTAFIIFASLILAIWINVFLSFDQNIWNYLQADILQANKKNNIWDIFLEKKDNKIILKAGKKLDSVENISLSLVYNPDNIALKGVFEKENENIDIFSNTPWISTILISFTQAKTINSWDEIISFDFVKNVWKTENINIINANFTDSNNKTFDLTTSSFQF